MENIYELTKDYVENVLNKALGKNFLKALNDKNYFTFIHLADSHNGYSGNASKHNEYRPLRITKKTENDINQRQDDIDKALKQVMDIAIHYNVNAVLHAGDGTDSWGYRRPYVLKTYMDQVERLYPHGIFYVEIAGNHNLPKERAASNYLEIIGKWPGVYTAFSGYKRISLDEHNVVIHCVPYTPSQEQLNRALDFVKPVPGKINIGMGHFGVTAIKHYNMDNRGYIPCVPLARLIQCQMEYFALGDYHKATDFGHNIRYSGSIERLSFGEASNQPQIVMGAIHKQTKEVIVRTLPLKVRPMIDFAEIDASGVPLNELNQIISKQLSSKDLTGAIVRLKIRNLPKEFKYGLDLQKIKKLTSSALYFKLELKSKEIFTHSTTQTKFSGVLEGWNEFVDQLPDKNNVFDKELLKRIGYERLAEAYETFTTE